jgi:HD superfamily phosphohydrolase
MVDLASFRAELKEASPTITRQIDALIEPWCKSILANLDRARSRESFPKTVNDPVWGVVELFPWEICLLDSPLLQRLRGVRQLGLANMVYPGASHSRLEHSLGVLEASERMMRALARNAEYHRTFGSDKDPEVPEVKEFDRFSVRTAALLHDTGHGPISHVSESILPEILPSYEYKRLEQHIRSFDGVMTIAPAELVSVVIVLSSQMKAVFEHPNFSNCSDRSEFPFAVAGRMLGARDFLRAGYLSGIVSGPLDADKLDYMARDSHHAGLPIGLDLNRLISKLEVVIVTPRNAHNKDLAQRAAASPNGRLFELGISLSGVGAYEQSVIGRVLLYDRLYHHHKVRAAESMARTLLAFCQREENSTITLQALYTSVSDEAFIAQLGNGTPEDSPSSRLARRIVMRDLYYRVFSFASRFLPVRHLSENTQQQSRVLIWNALLASVMKPDQRRTLAAEIVGLCQRIGETIPELKAASIGLGEQDVIIDLPSNKAVVRGNDILTRTESGDVAVPNLYFDPEGWAKAYESQKQVGYVFAPRSSASVVALASRIVFFERFHVATITEGEKASKTVDLVKQPWIDALSKAGLCSAQCAEVLRNPQIVLVPLNDRYLKIPDLWRDDRPDLASRICNELAEVFPAGLPGSTVDSIAATLEHLMSFIDVSEKRGERLESGFLEKDLQRALRDHLRSRTAEVLEGVEFGGGETDLLVGPGPGYTVIENKIAGRTDNPFDCKPDSPWQARRYSISVVQRVNFVVIGYEPITEAGVTSVTHRIDIRRTGTRTDLCASLIFVVPFCVSVPSKAKASREKL